MALSRGFSTVRLKPWNEPTSETFSLNHPTPLHPSICHCSAIHSCHDLCWSKPLNPTCPRIKVIIESDHKLKRSLCVCVTTTERDGGIIGRTRKRRGGMRKLWRIHCAQLMNGGIQMVVGGGRAQW